jgi:hypothetical protein
VHPQGIAVNILVNTRAPRSMGVDVIVGARVLIGENMTGGSCTPQGIGVYSTQG